MTLDTAILVHPIYDSAAMYAGLSLSQYKHLLRNYAVMQFIAKILNLPFNGTSHVFIKKT
jgi:hypothetical protein